jgi:hypothetical protein
MDKADKKRLKKTFQAQEHAETLAHVRITRRELEALLDHLDAAFPEEECDHTLGMTVEWARQHGVDEDAVRSTVEHFGGHCDCEVLANVPEPADLFRKPYPPN